MLHGQPYCDVCGYDGPNFMWMPHHGMSHGALVQNLDTFDLRTVAIPEHRPPREVSPTERETRFEDHVQSTVARQLGPDERHVPLSEFVRIGDENPFTDLPCPRCLQRLSWRHTGIS